MSNNFDVKLLIDTLDSLADEKYKRFHSGLCKTSKFEIKGVRMPLLKKLAKQLIKDGFADSLKAVEPSCYELVMIKALVIAGERKPLNLKLCDMEALIPEIDNWAVCDAFCSELKPKETELDTLFRFVKKHIYGSYEYEIRLAVVLILNYLITEEYIDEILPMLEKVDCNYYYTSMAVAWALSFCYINFPEKTFVFLKNCSLDSVTFKRTVQKIRDSYRISKEDKQRVKMLKRA